MQEGHKKIGFDAPEEVRIKYKMALAKLDRKIKEDLLKKVWDTIKEARGDKC